MESDHPYAYAMQYDLAFGDIKEWLSKNSYQGNVDSINNLGWFDGIAVYGLYDEDIVSFDDMHKKLKGEVKRQKEDDF